MTDDVLRRGYTSAELLLRYVDRDEFAGTPGAATVRTFALDRLSRGVSESELETRMIQLLRAHGLPDPVRQYEVRLAGRTVRFDLAYPGRLVAIELDGRAPHWGRERWQSDHDRRNEVELAGWRMLAFTWDDVTQHALRVAFTVGSKLQLRPKRWTDL
jgi:very-short-patch-repair endonuclease